MINFKVIYVLFSILPIVFNKKGLFDVKTFSFQANDFLLTHMAYEYRITCHQELF